MITVDEFWGEFTNFRKVSQSTVASPLREERSFVFGSRAKLYQFSV